MWLWLTSSLGFTSKNGLNAFYGSGISFPSSFLKNWQTWSFLVRFSRLSQSCSLWKWGHKSWIARYTSQLWWDLRVNRRLSKDSLCFEINPIFWQFSQVLQNVWVLKHGGPVKSTLSFLMRNDPHMPWNDKISWHYD